MKDLGLVDQLKDNHNHILMKTIRTFPKVCPSYNGTGFISEVGTSTNCARMCPACQGSKVVMVTEEEVPNINALSVLTVYN